MNTPAERCPIALAVAAAIKVTVTPEHIARGERGKCSRCPIALAVAEALAPLPPEHWVNVDARRGLPVAPIAFHLLPEPPRPLRRHHLTLVLEAITSPA